MIYEYLAPQGFSQLILLSGWYPPFWLRWVFFFSGCATTLVFIMCQERWSGALRQGILLLATSFFLAAVYITTLIYQDEVFINLEHSYNLFHFGKFSFSPSRMVDGTVEFLYYLILAPFAATRRSLLAASFCLGFTVLWAHLLLLSRFFRADRPLLKLFLLISFSMYASFGALFSSGFGNGLVSLIFLAGLVMQWRGRTAILPAMLLPLLRPDGIFYSGALAFGDLVQHRRLRWSMVFLPCLSLGFYFLAVQVVYGHWLPTAASFKFGNSPHSPADFLSGSIRFLKQHVQLCRELPLLFLAPALLIALRSDSRVRMLAVCMATMALAGVFYETSTTLSYLGLSRYYIGMELLVYFLPACLLAEYVSCPKRADLFRGISRRASALLLLAFACFFFWAIPPVSRVEIRRTEYLGASGQLWDRFFPSGWALAHTEMNAFGYFTDREILDLWGYTNPDIARSRKKNEWGLRVGDRILETMKPDAIWCWWLWAYLPGGYLARHPFYNPYTVGDYEALLTSMNGHEAVRNFPHEDWLGVYDLYVLFKGSPYAALYLVRKERGREFRSHLEKQGLKPGKERPLDEGRLRALAAAGHPPPFSGG